MPTPSLSLNVLQIQTPCNADWNAMPGTAARRHCADCDLHVHDLAALPRRKAEKLLAQSQTQRVCARVTRMPKARSSPVTAGAAPAANSPPPPASPSRSSASPAAATAPTRRSRPAPLHHRGRIRAVSAPVPGVIAPMPAPETATGRETLEVMGEMVAQPPVPAPAPPRLLGRIAVMGDVAAPATKPQAE